MNSVTVNTVYDHEADVGPMLRLPGELANHAGSDEIGGEPAGAAPEPLTADKRVPARRTAKSNAALYASVGLVALLLAGGYVIVRPAASHHLVQATTPPLSGLAPAASLANVPLPHLPPAVVHKKYSPEPAANELTELDGLRAGPLPAYSGATDLPPAAGTGTAGALLKPPAQGSAGTRPTPGPNGHAPGEGAPSAPRAAQTPLASYTPARSPAAPASPASPAIAPGTSNQNPVLSGATAPAATPGNQTAGAFKFTASTVVAARPATIAPAPPAPSTPPSPAQAGSMSIAQQTQLLQLVTQIATMERDDRIKQAVLTAEVQQLSGAVTGSMADYDRRLSLLEAQTAVSGAAQAGANTGVAAAVAVAPPAIQSRPTPASAPVPSAPSAVVPPAAPMPDASAQKPTSTPVEYHVQAASPGLAMLSVVGGDGSPLEVTVGDNIAGYGKVLAVVQQGDSWVVQTQSGNIN